MRPSFTGALLILLGVASPSRGKPLTGVPDAEPAPPRRAAPASRPTRSPLINAILTVTPDPATILDLIATGADVNWTDGRSTALYYAVTKSGQAPSMLSVVKAMVERGADVHARCIGGFRALHQACYLGSPSVVEYLVARGADVKVTDDLGITPLHVAAGRPGDYFPPEQRVAIIRLLVARGADVNARDKGGRTPRDYAREHVSDKEVGAVLAELDAKPPPPPPAATRPGDRPVPPK